MKKAIVVAVVCGCLGWVVGCGSVDDRAPQPFAYYQGYPGYAPYPAGPYHPYAPSYGQPMMYAYPGQPVAAPPGSAPPSSATPTEGTSDRRTMQLPCWRCRQWTTASSGTGMACRSCGAINWIP